MISQLAVRDDHLLDLAHTRNLPGIEAVAAIHCFRVDSRQIAGNLPFRSSGFAKARQLRMMFVAARLAPDDGLRQQPLTP